MKSTDAIDAQLATERLALEGTEKALSDATDRYLREPTNSHLRAGVAICQRELDDARQLIDSLETRRKTAEKEDKSPEKKAQRKERERFAQALRMAHDGLTERAQELDKAFANLTQRASEYAAARSLANEVANGYMGVCELTLEAHMHRVEQIQAVPTPLLMHTAAWLHGAVRALGLDTDPYVAFNLFEVPINRCIPLGGIAETNTKRIAEIIGEIEAAHHGC